MDENKKDHRALLDKAIELIRRVIEDRDDAEELQDAINILEDFEA